MTCDRCDGRRYCQVEIEPRRWRWVRCRCGWFAWAACWVWKRDVVATETGEVVG